MSSPLGAVFLGKYEVVGTLGRGSMGQVHLARPLDRPDLRVVIKVMRDSLAAESRFRTLFAHEIRLMAGFRHPYAVALVDASPDDPHGPCLVMEYVPGVTLQQLLRK